MGWLTPVGVEIFGRSAKYEREKPARCPCESDSKSTNASAELVVMGDGTTSAENDRQHTADG